MRLKPVIGHTTPIAVKAELTRALAAEEGELSLRSQLPRIERKSTLGPAETTVKRARIASQY